MELETRSKKELAEKVKELQSENNLLKNEKKEIWDTVKILITKLAHEIKTPLNSIIGFGELFKYKTDDIKLRNYMGNILKSSHFMLALIQNMIDVSSLQDRNMELSYSIFNTKDTITEIISEFNSQMINFTLIDSTICADYTRFKQVIYNLITNAIKYNSDNSPIEIITYLEDNNFCFEITDYGEEIKKEDREKVFEIFTQVSKNKSKREIGLGIGLALCKNIIVAHKGNITVNSGTENSTTFCFKIPIDFNQY